MTSRSPAKGAQGAPRRTYRSSLRAKQAEATRASIVASATRLFLAHGWADTGMRDIAQDAGVATETVYAHFPSKTALLQQAIDIAVVGDDAPAPVAARPEFLALGDGSRRDRVAAAAALVTAIHRRTSGFAKVIREAAHTDDTMAEMLRATRERQRLDVEAGAELLVGRPVTAIERDGLWAVLSVEVYLLLVEVTGWTTEQYEAWMVDTLERVVPASASA